MIESTALWVGGAVLQILPGQAEGAALAGQVGSMQGVDGMPGWLSRLQEGAGAALSNTVDGPFIIFMAVALLGTRAPTSRPAAAVDAFDGHSNPQQPSATNERWRQPDEVTGSEYPMNKRKRSIGLLIAVPVLLTGCAAAEATTGHVARIRPATSSPSTAPGMSPGMSMAPGESMPGMSSNKAAAGAQVPGIAAGPSKAAKMICGPETQRNVSTLMALPSPPAAKATWVNHTYTCTYALPGGPLVLSVKESAGVAAARGYFTATRGRSGHATTLSGLAGLGLPAFEDTTGKVVFLKDNMTLQVNPTALPLRVGPQQTSRADFAYTLATDILACWSE